MTNPKTFAQLVDLHDRVAGNIEGCPIGPNCLVCFPKKNVLDPVPMILTCPGCNERHIDIGEFAEKPHHTHACQFCGHVWRPAIEPTVGVQFLPGFKDGIGQDDLLELLELLENLLNSVEHGPEIAWHHWLYKRDALRVKIRAALEQYGR